ncbi:AAA family ATPase [Mycetocola reblochoni]|uniref:MoxR-like ATPases n=2 Tax=Mycetocola reblochoni TaxID=331618 RepID=A0A1R4JB75_9MICO|nr:MoxR family ATPase [Mycetocola reblochoni]RLP70014.1 MoxR family ATPase [Mycetocola reblochoni]SJN29286.1 MoxR-like ATPases [Mycetocola reblochoni REB411]
MSAERGDAHDDRTAPVEAAEAAAAVTGLDDDTARRIVGEVVSRVGTVVDGKDDVITLAAVVLLAEGHLLVEDVPGVGKTVLARAFAKAIGGRVSRIQFTPDLLPSDVTGVTTYHRDTSRFEFVPGPVFANIVIGDEINRASPKTQSALLECMAERQVTVDGTSHPLPRPFTVFATQNPIEMEGTFPLPEAQRDRFMARVSMGYPDVDSEAALVAARARRNPLDALEPVTDARQFALVVARVHEVFVADAVTRYAVDLVRATREHPEVRVGASPRATLHLVHAARALAFVSGRGFVVPEDVIGLADAVLAHRLVLADRGADEREALRIVAECRASVPVPRGR